MAIRYAVADGNWSNTATWDGGTLPASNDIVYANGKTVTVDINVTVDLIINQTLASPSILVGGSFTLNDGITLTATSGFTPRQTLLNITGSNSATLIGTINPSTGGTTTIYGLNMQNSSNITITGSVFGGASSTNIGIYHQSTGTLNVLGNVEGRVTTACYGIQKINTGIINISGNLVSSRTTTVPGLFITNGASIITITGSVLGINSAGYQDNSTGNGTSLIVSGSVISTTNNIGAIYKTTQGTITIIGPITAGTNRPGLETSANVTDVFLTGPFYNTNNINAVYSPKFQLIPGSTPTWTFDTETYGEQRTLYTLDYPGNFPATTNVRQGTVFGDTNQFTGTLILPSTSNVLKGVPVDATTGSASFTTQNVWSVATSSLSATGSIGERLVSASTVTTDANLITSKGTL